MNSLLSVIFTLLSFLILQDDGLLHIVHADRSIGRVQDGKQIRVLSGNVEAYQDTIRMFFDEGIYFENDERAQFTGNVVIDDGHHVLRANKILYYPKERLAHCMGRVRISGANDSLYAEVFYYYFREGDARGQKNVFVWDKANKARIWGDAGYYHSSSKRTEIEGNARFEHSEEQATDTLRITAGRMKYFGLQPKMAVALDSVNITKGNVKAICDSAIYMVEAERVELRLQPLAWQGDSEMRGATIDLKLDSLEIREIFLSENASIKSLADTLTQRYDQLHAKSIQVSLEDRQPYRVIARNNARSIYMLENEGVNSASADSIILFFKEGEMDSISMIGGGEGIFYPQEYRGEIKGEQ